MSRNWARFLAGVVSVALIWIVAYWWLNSGPSDKISFGGPASADAATTLPPAPKPQPREPLKVVDYKRDFAPAAGGATSRPDESTKVAPAKASTSTMAANASGGTPAVIPPKFEDYTVKRGDTLSSIAASRWGSTKHIEALRRSNPLKDMDRLKVGDVIRIPVDPANIQGKPVEGAPSPAPPPNRQGEVLEYTVRSGDTLSKIAKEKYGSSSFQDLIYQANRDRLSSPNSLKEGQKLRLPPKPAS